MDKKADAYISDLRAVIQLEQAIEFIKKAELIEVTPYK